MTPVEAYTILILMFGSIATIFGGVVYWMRKNSIMISIDESMEGVLMNNSFRARVVNKTEKRKVQKEVETRRWIWFGAKMKTMKTVTVKDKVGRFHPMQDLLTRKHIEGLKFSDVEDGLIITESLPILGVTHTLNLKVINPDDNTTTKVTTKLNDSHVEVSKFLVWYPPVQLDKKGLINNIRMVKTNNLREELWASTDNTTKAEMLFKVILPISLMVLAVMMLIFFPKIYETIMGSSQAALESAKMGWQDMVGQVKPLG